MHRIRSKPERQRNNNDDYWLKLLSKLVKFNKIITNFPRIYIVRARNQLALALFHFKWIARGRIAKRRMTRRVRKSERRPVEKQVRVEQELKAELEEKVEGSEGECVISNMFMQLSYHEFAVMHCNFTKWCSCLIYTVTMSCTPSSILPYK